MTTYRVTLTPASRGFGYDWSEIDAGAAEAEILKGRALPETLKA